MSDTRDNFGPEEFTLFVMSKMLGLCDDVDEARLFQIGAAKYILKSAESPAGRLSAGHRRRASDAAAYSAPGRDVREQHRTLRGPRRGRPTWTGHRPMPPCRPRHLVKRRRSPEPRLRPQSLSQRHCLAPPPATPAATSRPQRLQPRGTPSNDPQMQPGRGRSAKGSSNVSELLVLLTVIFIGIALTSLVLLGYIDPSDLTATERERVGITLR